MCAECWNEAFTLVLLHRYSTNDVILILSVSFFLSLFWYLCIAKAKDDVPMLCSLFLFDRMLAPKVAIFQVGSRLKEHRAFCSLEFLWDPSFCEGVPEDPVSMDFDMLSAGGHSFCVSSCQCKHVVTVLSKTKRWVESSNRSPVSPITEASVMKRWHLAWHMSSQFTADLIRWLDLVGCCWTCSLGARSSV